jgi:hypothetical protein
VVAFCAGELAILANRGYMLNGVAVAVVLVKK